MDLKRDLFKTDSSEITNEIMTYLANHPNAADTLDGVAKWWLLDRADKLQLGQVKQALDELVAKGLVAAQKGGDSKIVYRVNRSRLEDIKKRSRGEVGSDHA